MVSLKTEFERIKAMNWVPSLRRGTTGIGYTFETLLNKPEESFELPDYGSIEIKTKNIFSPTSIKLFCATPDGDELFAIQKLRDQFGYPDKIHSETLVFNGNVGSTNFTPIGSHYLFKLKVDEQSQVIRLLVIDLNCNFICNNISWSFDMLKQKLLRKLSYLAIVEAEKKFEHKQVFYKYKRITFYKLKDFNTFIKLINNGIIKVNFTIGTIKKGPRKGQTHDHGTKFEIDLKNITSLYDKIY